VERRRRVAVLGPEAARTLFGPSDPVGRDVLAGGVWYRVVGVLEDRAQPASRRRPVPLVDTDAALLVPRTTMDRRLGEGDAGDRVEMIGVRLADLDAVDAAVAMLRGVLERRHRDPASIRRASPPASTRSTPSARGSGS
jgi:putative ABC transport system permease protein